MGKSARTRSTSSGTGGGEANVREGAAVMARSEPAEAVEDQSVELEPHRCKGHLIHHLRRERVEEQAFRRVRGQSPAPGVEEGHFVELSDSRAMGALHVVREDLELGL